MNREFTAEQMRFIHAIQPDLIKLAALFSRVGLGLSMDWFRLPPTPPPSPSPDNVVPINKKKRLKVVQ